MAMRVNVSEAAIVAKVSNDPGLPEKQIKVESLVFYDRDGIPHPVPGCPKNRTGRLWYQIQMGLMGRQRFELTDSIRKRARVYFDKYAVDATVEDRPLIWWTLNGTGVLVLVK